MKKISDVIRILMPFWSIVIVWSLFPVSAQTLDSLKKKTPISVVKKNSEGTEFWLCFTRNYMTERRDGIGNANQIINLELFITANVTSKVTVEIDGIGYKRQVKVEGGTVTNLTVDPSAQVMGEEVIQRLGVHVTSDNPISVYGLSRRWQTTDTYLGLPVSVLGTEYRAICYSFSEGMMSQFSVIATEDSTKVTIIPTVKTRKHAADKPYSIMLNRGDVFPVGAEVEGGGTGDLTGTLIRANKKIAVFSGHQCAYVPRGLIGCNHLVEQLPPINAWGKHYYAGKLERRSRSTIRVVASQPQTKVFENSTLVSVLDAGQFYENSNVRQNLQITADKPVLLAQYSQGFTNGDDVGDPMMLLISPTQQFLKQYRFVTPINGEWKHYVNIVIPTRAIPTLRLNNRKLDTSQFQRMGISRYSIAQVQIPFGTHTIVADEPFGLSSYGFGYGGQAYDAYGNMGGQSFDEIIEEADTLPPMGDSRIVDSRINVIFRDDRTTDKGLKSIRVVFAKNMQTSIPKIEAGVPQINFLVKTIDQSAAGRMVLEAVDVANNRSIYTVCHSFDPITNDFTFTMRDGERDDCDEEPGWQYGASFGWQRNFNFADFSGSAGIPTNGTFSTGTAPGWTFGVTAGKRITGTLGITGKLSIEDRPATIVSPDSTVSFIRDVESNILIPLQEGTQWKTGYHAALTLVGEWYFTQTLYLIGGARIAMPLGNTVEQQRVILTPSDYRYSETGARNKPIENRELSSLRLLQFGAIGGIGGQYIYDSKITVNVEATYLYGLNSILSDAVWNANFLTAHLGVRYRW